MFSATAPKSIFEIECELYVHRLDRWNRHFLFPSPSKYFPNFFFLLKNILHRMKCAEWTPMGVAIWPKVRRPFHFPISKHQNPKVKMRWFLHLKICKFGWMSRHMGNHDTYNIHTKWRNENECGKKKHLHKETRDTYFVSETIEINVMNKKRASNQNVRR